MKRNKNLDKIMSDNEGILAFREITSGRKRDTTITLSTGERFTLELKPHTPDCADGLELYGVSYSYETCFDRVEKHRDVRYVVANSEDDAIEKADVWWDGHIARSGGYLAGIEPRRSVWKPTKKISSPKLTGDDKKRYTIENRLGSDGVTVTYSVKKK